MVRPARNSREAKIRRVQKKLEGVDYIPRVAKYLAGILVALSENSQSHRNAILQEFEKAANEKPTWAIAGGRL